MVTKNGPEASYQLAPRAQIFRRDAGALETLADIQAFMRLNNYKRGDPLAPTPFVRRDATSSLSLSSPESPLFFFLSPFSSSSSSLLLLFLLLFSLFYFIVGCYFIAR